MQLFGEDSFLIILCHFAIAIQLAFALLFSFRLLHIMRYASDKGLECPLELLLD